MTPPVLIDSNSDFCVVAKPVGWTVQRSEGQRGLLDWAREQTGSEVYPVHRLDRPTSGLVLIALTPEANRQLSGLFREKAVRKQYLAVSDRKPQKKQGWVIGDMERSRRGQWRLLRSRNNPAVTRFQSCALAAGIRGFELYPQTGKTHQLRVALKSVGSPILGDRRYGGTADERVYLHAHRLSFQFGGRDWQFQAEPEGEWFERWAAQGLPDWPSETERENS